MVGLVCWILIPLIGLWQLRGQERDARLRHRRPTWVPTVPSTVGEQLEAGLHLHWDAPDPMVAPAWSGVLSQLTAHAGERIQDGDVVAVVDRVQRVAVASRRPFTRPLALGASGDDVADLNAYLGRHGFEHGTASEFTTATWRGVSRLSASLGLASTPVFDPAWALFLAKDGATIATTTGTVGAPAPAAGEPVATFEPELISVRVIAAQPGLVGSEGQPTAPAKDDPAALATTIDRRLASVDALVVPAGSTLRVGGVDLELDARRGEVDRSSLAVVAEQASTDPYLEVTIERPPAPGSLELPAAAVFSDERGRSCVRVRRSGKTGSARVQVIGGSGGRATVTVVAGSSLRAGDDVEVDVPGPDRSCR